jgi:hypothetical protein
MSDPTDIMPISFCGKSIDYCFSKLVFDPWCDWESLSYIKVFGICRHAGQLTVIQLKTVGLWSTTCRHNMGTNGGGYLIYALTNNITHSKIYLDNCRTYLQLLNYILYNNNSTIIIQRWDGTRARANATAWISCYSATIQKCRSSRVWHHQYR